MHSVLLLFQKKKDEAERKKALLGNQLNNNFIEMLKEEEEVEDTYTIEKDLIIEAWQRYRPASNENSPEPEKNGGFSPVSPKKKDIQEIYGDNFLSKLMAGIKQKKSG